MAGRFPMRFLQAVNMKISLRPLLVLGIFIWLPIQAQGQDSLRPLPPVAAKAEMRVLAERTVTLNGTPYNLSPGAQIRNEQNMIVLTQTLLERGAVKVRVLLDANGDVSNAWILTPGEEAQEAPKLK